MPLHTYIIRIIRTVNYRTAFLLYFNASARATGVFVYIIRHRTIFNNTISYTRAIQNVIRARAIQSRAALGRRTDAREKRRRPTEPTNHPPTAVSIRVCVYVYIVFTIQ